jgi:hypothetical protein
MEEEKVEAINDTYSTENSAKKEKEEPYKSIIKPHP